MFLYKWQLRADDSSSKKGQFKIQPFIALKKAREVSLKDNVVDLWQFIFPNFSRKKRNVFTPNRNLYSSIHKTKSSHR